ncbi:unnamed protein product [Aspergillus oryzae var. brunneus]|uniref:Unnamed protein product n=2 Tax=Aspergillus oryzae TaxID=5062 RepID=A0AAN4YH05_ASPOZ|nr:unnamed protein product [Aspergillus oryzae]GMG46123.1 unnamed protein product [Aspergillus oryzae var. brunneus]
MATAGIERRVEIKIASSSEDFMCGWLYSSQKFTVSNLGPAIVLAHGLGGTKELKLDVYADSFNQMGYTCVVFDYRCTGGSEGLPRGLIDWHQQQEDWKSAIKYTRQLENIDPNQVGLFGTSFSGGHVIQLAATDRKLNAAISQCPFTSGWQSTLCTGSAATPRLAGIGLLDILFGSERKPITVPLTGRPGEAALMNAPDMLSTFPLLIPKGHPFQERVPARLTLKLPLLRSGSYASRVECPILFGICGKDSVAPADTTLAYAKTAPKGVIKCLMIYKWPHLIGQSAQAHVFPRLSTWTTILSIDLTSTHMDLLSVLPDFHTKPYAHILPPLERSKISTVDLITLDTLEIAKRAHVPPADVRRLCASITKALHHDIGFEHIEESASAEPSSSINDDPPITLGPTTKLDLSQWSAISTLDTALDELLGGGIPTGYVTEVTGESGKTQFLLSLLLAVQLPSPKGLGKNAVYISTEAPLSTPRLSQLINSNPYLSTLPRDRAPTLENILSINAMDLESQDHILNYQLPVAIQRYNVGLVVIDSITSNYRAEHTSHNILGLSTRSGELTKLGQMLRNLAVQEDIAIVVANQVSDRFDAMDNPSVFPRIGGGAGNGSPSTQPQQIPSARESGTASPLPRVRATESGNVELSQYNAMLPSSPSHFPSSPYTTEEDPQRQHFDGSYLVGNPVRSEILSLLHQQRFFTGWGDSPQSFLPSSYPGFQRPAEKTPALGLVWSTQIACRIALKKERQTAMDPLLPESTPIPSTAKLLPEPEVPGSLGEREKPEPDPPTETVTEGKDAEAKASSETVPVPAPISENKPSNSQLPPPSSQTPERLVRRTMKLVFAPWTAGSVNEQNQIQDEVSFTIWKGGLKSCE